VLLYQTARFTGRWKQLEENLSTMIVQTANAYAVDLSVFDDEFLTKSFFRKYEASGMNNPIEYCAFLQENHIEATDFFQSLIITYTTFFRDPFMFTYLEHRIIPALVRNAQAGSEIRIWSAGCSSGPEAYSIAILIDEQIQLIQKEIRFRVFATDISGEVLSIAREGIYDATAMQNVKLKHLQQYFSESNGKYSVSANLKNHVSFSAYDLLDTSSANPPDSIFGNFDLISCNNLLMYYKKEIRLNILKKFERSLAPNGLLAVSEAERAFVKNSTKFQPISMPIAVFYNPNNS